MNAKNIMESFPEATEVWTSGSESFLKKEDAEAYATHFNLGVKRELRQDVMGIEAGHNVTIQKPVMEDANTDDKAKADADAKAKADADAKAKVDAEAKAKADADAKAKADADAKAKVDAEAKAKADADAKAKVDAEAKAKADADAKADPAV
jgi:membrane protein involved in colicin uptake